jgi:hypothetical protein
MNIQQTIPIQSDEFDRRYLTKLCSEQGQALGTAHNALMDANQVLGRCLSSAHDAGQSSLCAAIKDCQRVIDEAIEAIVS